MRSAVLRSERLPLNAACLQKPLTMIDSSKKQQQGFPEILTAGDFEPFKEKECLEGSNQKSLKEGQFVPGQEHECGHPAPVTWLVSFPSAFHLSVCLSAHCYPILPEVYTVST